MKEASKSTMFGKLLTRVHNARYQTRQLAELELWRRHSLGNPKNRVGYKMAETAVIQRDGTEVIEFRLYKLIDRAVISISSEVQTTTEFGLDATEKEQADGTKSTNTDT
jgi:hypothetical protein